MSLGFSLPLLPFCQVVILEQNWGYHGKRVLGKEYCEQSRKQCSRVQQRIKIFCLQFFQGLFTWHPTVLLQCLLHFYRRKGYLLSQCYSNGRMKSFGYRAVCDPSSRLRGDIFAPMTSKLPLVYWLANRENWFLTNSPVLSPEHSCHFSKCAFTQSYKLSQSSIHSRCCKR